MSKIIKTTHPYIIYIYIGIVAFMATIFGFNLGAMLSSKNRLLNIFMLEIYDIDSMVTTFLLGALSGAFLGGRSSNYSGRVLPIVGSFFIGVIGECSTILAPTFSTLFISEFAVGGAFGMYMVSAVCYLTEISPQNRRGSACTSIGVFFILGIFLAASLKDYIPQNAILFATCMCIIAFPLMLVAYFRLPESPRYLAISAQSDKALSVLIKIRNSTAKASRELAGINECAYGEDRGVGLFFHNGVYRHILWALLSAIFMCHLAGVLIIPYTAIDFVKISRNAADFFSNRYSDDFYFMILKANLTAALIGSIVSCIFIEKFGRKRLILTSLVVNEVILTILYLLNYAFEYRASSIFSAAFLLIYVFSATIVLNVIITTLISEILPLKGRELGLTVMSLVNICLVMMGIYFFNNVSKSAGHTTLIAFFMVTHLILFAIIYLVFPETSGRMLESMENIIFNKKSIIALKREYEQEKDNKDK